MSRGPRAPRREPVKPVRPPRPWDALRENETVLILVCVASALWVQRRALTAFFALDDLVIMEAVRGLRPLTIGPWRLLSRHLFFGAAVPAFGANPLPYHVIAWLLHGANVALLYLFTRRWGAGRLAAVTAAVLFGTTRLHASTLESPARIGEPLALALTLAALLMSDRGVLARTAGAVAFALAMLAKESVALVPAVLLLPRPGAPPFVVRLHRAAPLLAAAAVVTLVLVTSGAGSTHLGGEAYTRGFGANLFLNLMTYARWATDLSDPLPGQVSAIAERAWPLGLAVTLALASLAFVTRRRTSLVSLGLLWWLLALIPVLPLIHHTYLYYLYAPLAGLATALAGLVEWGVTQVSVRPERSRERGARGSGARPAGAAPALALALAIAVPGLLVVHAVTAERLLDRRLRMHMPGTGIPLDPDLRKSEMARQASAGVASHLAGRHARVAFLMPEALREVLSTTTGQSLPDTMPAAASYPMLEGALDGGMGLRALLPNVDSVAFLRRWARGYADFEIFSQNSDGQVFPLGRGPDGFATAGNAIMKGGNPGLARDLLAEALTEFPDHARLRFHYAHALQLTGDSLGMRHQLEELVRRAPSDPLAAPVRAELARKRNP